VRGALGCCTCLVLTLHAIRNSAVTYHLPLLLDTHPPTHHINRSMMDPMVLARAQKDPEFFKCIREVRVGCVLLLVGIGGRQGGSRC